VLRTMGLSSSSSWKLFLECRVRLTGRSRPSCGWADPVRKSTLALQPVRLRHTNGVCRRKNAEFGAELRRRTPLPPAARRPSVPMSCLPSRNGCAMPCPAPGPPFAERLGTAAAAAGARRRGLRRASPRPARGGRAAGAARLLRRHLHPRGAGQRRHRDRSRVPGAAGRALGRHRRPPRVPALRRGRGGAAGAHRHRALPGRPARRGLPLRGHRVEVDQVSEFYEHTPARGASRRRRWPAPWAGRRPCS
jgi:hypothetical protein